MNQNTPTQPVNRLYKTGTGSFLGRGARVSFERTHSKETGKRIFHPRHCGGIGRRRDFNFQINSGNAGSIMEKQKIFPSDSAFLKCHALMGRCSFSVKFPNPAASHSGSKYSELV